MIDHAGFQDRAARLSEVLRQHLGVRGRDMGARLRRARRMLPRRLRPQADRLSHAEVMLRHPRLARLVDMPEVERAFAAIEAHALTVDPAARRRHAALSVLVAAVFNLILLALALWAVLHWVPAS